MMDRGLSQDYSLEQLRRWVKTVNWSVREAAKAAGMDFKDFENYWYGRPGRPDLPVHNWRRLRLRIGCILADSQAHLREVQRRKHSQVWRHELKRELARRRGEDLPKMKTLGSLDLPSG